MNFLNVSIGKVRNVRLSENEDAGAVINWTIAHADPGDIIRIAEGNYLLNTAITVNKPITLIGNGPLTRFIHNAPVSLFGSGVLIGVLAPNVVLRDFSIVADRIADPTMRISAIKIIQGNNIIVDRINFEGITSSCVIAQGPNIHTCAIVNCTANEFYEQFVEIASSPAHDFWIEGNFASSTTSHPDIQGVEPFGIAMTPGLSFPEDQTGLLERVYVINNTINFLGMPDDDRVNTGGVQISSDGANQIPSKPYRQTNYYIAGNSFIGCGWGVRIQEMRNLLDVPSHGYLSVENNTFKSITLHPIDISPQHAEDHIVIGNNLIWRNQAWEPYSGSHMTPNVHKIRNRQIEEGQTEAQAYFLD
jgi:hypothetical protein